MTDHVQRRIDEATDRLPAAAAAHSDAARWMSIMRRDHPKGGSYDSDGSPSGDVVDLSARVVRPDPATRDAKRYREAWDRVVNDLRLIDNIQSRYRTAANALGFRGDDESMWCRGHLDAGSREPRAKGCGDECRACADFRRSQKRKPTKEEIDLRARTGRWPRTTSVAS